MIPYEELVAALARWRARRGLPTGLGDYLGEPARASFDPAQGDHSREDVVELGDEALEGELEPVHAYGAYAGEADMHAAADVGDGDDGFDRSGESADLMEFGAPGSEESTRPAGLAGLVDGPGAAQGAAPAAPDGPHGAVEAKPPARGRSPRGGRRRRK
ncbi:MAG TPA: hypothetical protein VKB80_04480 [Kofleriaceae bacterium]|nr:hypothetical protein [Kofleriaceae bacterium]